MSELVIAELTDSTLQGAGAFDTVMRSITAHLDSEFTKGRVKGPEYSTVYLGSLELAMKIGLDFVLQKRKNELEAELLRKQGLMLDAQILVANAQVEIARAEVLIKEKQIELATAELGIAQAKLVNIPKEGLKLDAETLLLTRNAANALLEGAVLVAQECKLRAEFDLTMAQVTKSNGEIALLAQKVATERAQTTAMGVDEDSVVGRQKGLYQAQTAGFTRDAEQKAAKILIDTWSVRRTTDEGTVADGTNKLNDATVGRLVDKLLTGVGA